MSILRLDLESYGLLSVKERALYIVRDHLNSWFQALTDDVKIKEMKANAKRNENRSASSLARHS